jgi:hypothetical protein
MTKPSIEISSFSFHEANKSIDDFVKYDIEIMLDEVENSDLGIKLKYKLVLVSNPPNIKIVTEGIASIVGQESEVNKQLEPDKRHIPLVVNTIYQEIFPLLYMVSTSMQIPCPAYKLSQISPTSQPEIIQDVHQVQEKSERMDISNSSAGSDDNSVQLESSPEPTLQEFINEPNVNAI